jgi:DNA-binding transcriptional LysR family regulator
MSINLVTCMRVFAAVVDTGSFAGASDKLDLSRGMATRYVAQLEQHLGVRLLTRSTRRLSLTEVGSEYYQRAVQVLAMVEESERSLAHQASVPRGTLRLSSSVAFGIHHLGWVVTEYLQQYPEVQIDVVLNDRTVNLIEEGFDLAIRIGRELEPGLIARRIAPTEVVACAAPDYLKRLGTPKQPEDLVGHNCLSYAYWSLGNEWRFRKNGVERKVAVSGNLRGNTGDILIDAAIKGLGILLQPSFLVYEALRDKRLVRILPEWEVDPLFVYAVYPDRKFLPSKVRSFIDFIADRMGPEPYWQLKPS